MSRTPLSTRIPSLTLSAAGVLLTGVAAQADITIEQRMAVEGAGAMAMANMTGTTVMAISGDKSHTESDMQMQSKLVRMFAHGIGQSSEIVRLDQDKIYDLNVKKKQYTETSLADKRAQLAKIMEQSRAAQEKQPAATGMDESECEWSEPKVEVNKTGAKATIAGFTAEQTTIVAQQSCTNRKTGAVCDMALSLDQWLSPDFDGGGQEVMQFHQAYAQKMGFTAGDQRDATARAEALFGRYKGMWAQVADKMRNVKGYPVRSSFALGFGGPRCQNAQEAQNLPPAPPPGAMSGAVAGAAGQAAGQAVASKAGQSALGGFAGELGGKIAGSLWKKKKEQQAQQTQAAQPATAPPPAPAATNGLITPLRVTSELVSVKKDPIPASAFEVPADFKKVAEK